MPVTKSVFDSCENITLFTISNGSLKVNILDYGATIQSILFADKNRIVRDVVLGFDDFERYQADRWQSPYFGSTIGRIGNRIAHASFDLNGKHYKLASDKHYGGNTLHGGAHGFDAKKWTLTSEGNDHITLTYTSPHLEEGFPGKLLSSLKFTVTQQNELKLDYTAKLEGDEADATIVNLTNHTYFNLNGVYDNESSQVRNHQIRMHSSHYLEVDDNLIPSGTLLPTKGTDLDLATGKHAIGERVDNIQPRGYDHCYALETDPSKFVIDAVNVKKAVVVVYSPLTGIRMTLSTGEPSVQFYAGSKIPEHSPKKSQNDGSVKYGAYAGLCLEAQRYVDAIHHKQWEKQVVLAKGQTYKQSTVYKFELAHQL